MDGWQSSEQLVWGQSGGHVRIPGHWRVIQALEHFLEKLLRLVCSQLVLLLRPPVVVVVDGGVAPVDHLEGGETLVVRV